MKKLENCVIVYLDAELTAWLKKKESNGYKKSSFVRHVLERQKSFEESRKAGSASDARKMAAAFDTK